MGKHSTANLTGWVRNVDEWRLAGFTNGASLAFLILIYNRNTGMLPDMKYIEAYVEGMTVRSTNG